MNVKLSPLKVDQFGIVASRLLWIEPENGPPESWDAQFAQYDIDIDFGIESQEEGQHLAWVSVGVNNIDNPLPGYSLSADGFGTFSGEGAEALDPRVLSNLKSFSSINMVLNKLRGHLALLTASSILGVYELPAIDIADCMRRKFAEQKNVKE
jgi:hypothetical protein